MKHADEIIKLLEEILQISTDTEPSLDDLSSPWSALGRIQSMAEYALEKAKDEE